MPASLNCPTCGAPASGPEATQCDYCGSTLTTVGCPECLGVMFAGMQHCPHCGAKSNRLVDENATLTCPGCKGRMQGVTVGHTRVGDGRREVDRGEETLALAAPSDDDLLPFSASDDEH
jgi:hypothetical protein